MSVKVGTTEVRGLNVQFTNSDYLTKTEAATQYQGILVSGETIKTVGGNSLIGSGDISPFWSIDVTNLLYTTTSWINTEPYYVATEDCIVIVSYTGFCVYIVVDDVPMCRSNTNSSDTATFWAPLKKGQTLRVYQTGNHSGVTATTYVYGIK